MITRETREIDRAQRVGFISYDGREDEVGLEVENPIEVISLQDRHTIVIPVILRLAFRSVENQVLAFRPPVKVKILA